MKLMTLIAATVALVAGGALAAGDHSPDPIRVALLPDENAATVIQDNQPLAAHLEATLGREIELIVTTDYSSMIEAMRFGRVDVAYFGPASYTIARARMEGSDLMIEPFAARVRGGSATYQSVLIANAESGITAIADIEGSGIDVAFGDQASTSSHFAPKYTMLREGVAPGEDYEENFTGAHDAVARNVEIGNAQVGGLSLPIFERLLERGTVDADRVVVIGHSADIPQYPWVMRTDLTQDLQDNIRSAFLDLQPGTEVGDAILGPFSADGFAPIADQDYDIIRDIRAALQN